MKYTTCFRYYPDNRNPLHPVWGYLMTPEERERMNVLCAGIQEERSYEKYAALLRELSELIEKKEQRRFQNHPKLIWSHNRPYKTVPAVVNKILQPRNPDQPQKIEITLTPADPLFREVRLENTFHGVDGQMVALQNGAQVQVTFEANPGDVVPPTNGLPKAS